MVSPKVVIGASVVVITAALCMIFVTVIKHSTSTLSQQIATPTPISTPTPIMAVTYFNITPDFLYGLGVGMLFGILIGIIVYALFSIIIGVRGDKCNGEHQTKKQ